MRKGLISKDDSFRNLSRKFLEKARLNLTTMRLLYEFNQDKRARDILKVPKDYNSDEWVVIAGYYAMYSAALSLIAKIGFRSKNHAATISLLDEFYVKKKLLHKGDLNIISNASLKKEELESLSDARHKREIAQYSVTKQTTKTIAEKIKTEAYNFVNKCSELIEINDR